MNRVSFEGIGAVVATFSTLDGVKPGMVVKVSGSGEVGPTAAGERFFGVALNSRGGCAAVQMSGLAVVPASGAVVAGWSKLSADGAGGVKTDANGTEFLVVAFDSGAGTAVVQL